MYRKDISGINTHPGTYIYLSTGANTHLYTHTYAHTHTSKRCRTQKFRWHVAQVKGIASFCLQPGTLHFANDGTCEESAAGVVHPRVMCSSTSALGSSPAGTGTMQPHIGQGGALAFWESHAVCENEDCVPCYCN